MCHRVEIVRNVVCYLYFVLSLQSVSKNTIFIFLQTLRAYPKNYQHDITECFTYVMYYRQSLYTLFIFKSIQTPYKDKSNLL